MSNSPTKDFSWIKVPRFRDDDTKTWEDRFRALEKHHVAETTFLIEEVERLRCVVSAYAANGQHLDTCPNAEPPADIPVSKSQMRRLAVQKQAKGATMSYEAAEAAIEATSSLKDDWNGFGSVAPNDVARRGAVAALTAMRGLDLYPNTVSALADFGVAFTFRRGDHFALFEVYNDGEAGVTMDDGSSARRGWDFKAHDLAEVQNAVQAITNHLERKSRE